MNVDRRDSEQVYDEQAGDFAAKAPKLLTWEFIVSPAIKKHFEPFFSSRDKKDIKARVEGCASGRDVATIVAGGIPQAI